MFPMTRRQKQGCARNLLTWAPDIQGLLVFGGGAPAQLDVALESGPARRGCAAHGYEWLENDYSPLYLHPVRRSNSFVTKTWYPPQDCFERWPAPVASNSCCSQLRTLALITDACVIAQNLSINQHR
jgi:hypothetical protein